MPRKGNQCSRSSYSLAVRVARVLSSALGIEFLVKAQPALEEHNGIGVVLSDCSVTASAPWDDRKVATDSYQERSASFGALLRPSILPLMIDLQPPGALSV